MNREKAIRQAYFDALDGQLTYNGPVGVYDEKLEDSADLYVLLLNQDAQYIGNFRDQRWNCLLTIDIVYKQQNSISKDPLDDVCEQIENIVTTSASTNGLAAQSGWQIINVSLQSVSYSFLQDSPTRSILTKTLSFNQIVIKT